MCRIAVKSKINLLIVVLLVLGAPLFFYIIAFSQNTVKLVIEILLWLLMSVVPIYGILKRKTWALTLCSAILIFCIFSFLSHVFIFGIYGEGRTLVLSPLIYLALFVLLKDREMRSEFLITEKQLRREKISNRLTLIFIVGFLVLYGAFRLVYKLDFPAVGKVNLGSNKENFSEDQYSTQQIAGWQIPIPKEVKIVKDSSGLYAFAFFVNEEKTVRIIIDKSPLADFQMEAFKFININSSHDFFQKVYKERVGVLFLILRAMLAGSIDTLHEFEAGNLRGFRSLRKGESEDGSNVYIYAYSIFDKQDHDINILFQVKSNTMTEEQVNQIVANAKFLD